MDQHVTQSNVEKPVWLEDFLKGNFSDSCSLHQTRKNELNKYCIYCKKLCCQFCVSFGLHRHHKMLKVSRHAYKDVVSLHAMEKYLDCSQIQTYKCNRRVVISLNPLELNEISSEESCKVCKIKLNEPNLYSYCSISCKVEALSKKSEPEDPARAIIIESSSGPSTESPQPVALCLPKQTQERASEPSLRKRKRKGSPHRSPLF